LPGFVAEHEGRREGVITYQIACGACEIVSIDGDRPGRGVGTALIEAVVAEARRHGCVRVWLVTTNDNLPALRFYQKRGFALVAVHANAVERSRQSKPEIPLIVRDGIPIRDEIELELRTVGGKAPT
jgi:GNAT superfamily N-acetyltransferase